MLLLESKHWFRDDIAGISECCDVPRNMIIKMNNLTDLLTKEKIFTSWRSSTQIQYPKMVKRCMDGFVGGLGCGDDTVSD